MLLRLNCGACTLHTPREIQSDYWKNLVFVRQNCSSAPRDDSETDMYRGNKGIEPYFSPDSTTCFMVKIVRK